MDTVKQAGRSVRGRLVTFLDAASSMALLLAAATALWFFLAPTRSRSAMVPAPPSTPLSLDGAAVLGSPQASIAMIVFSDFQCPFCKRFAEETLPALESSYIRPGRLLFAFRHFPLTQIHPLAFRAAETAECARQQGQFWPVHDLLFRDLDRSLSAVGLPALLKKVDLTLNEPTFRTCLDAGGSARVQADSDEARRLGITGTPAFLLGSVQADGRVRIQERISGSRGFEEFQLVLARMLR